jgi:hypothetical protein
MEGAHGRPWRPPTVRQQHCLALEWLGENAPDRWEGREARPHEWAPRIRAKMSGPSKSTLRLSTRVMT